MSFGKTSKQEQSQQIDPMLRDEAIANTNLIRALAGLGFNPFLGNQMSGITDATMVAANMADSAANAFGFGGGAAKGLEGLRGTDDGSGIKGFSPFEGMKAAMGDEYDAFREQLDAWFKQASKKTAYKPQLTTGGGGKK